ncbi:uncharacterized protein LOC113353508 [Papaver somniferum]|uniref:uncharacterized protein LOC113353508 n=1 Tax=Papaver somniferum TaxID=3469 RepID=UPI000E6FEB3F|nr:uncharacterized protein LOC113353508 [Papaver somniferum]XP_026452863.1 uncharacterized protein LOC113353508 [Papaver somniferum]
MDEQERNATLIAGPVRDIVHLFLDDPRSSNYTQFNRASDLLVDIYSCDRIIRFHGHTKPTLSAEVELIPQWQKSNLGADHTGILRALHISQTPGREILFCVSYLEIYNKNSFFLRHRKPKSCGSAKHIKDGY